MKILHFSELPWVNTTHDAESVGVLKKAIFWEEQIGRFLMGKQPFINLAKLMPGGSFSSHHHASDGDQLKIPQEIVGMDEVFIPISGKAIMKIESNEGIWEGEISPGMIVLVERGEIHAMSNQSVNDFIYMVYGVSTGGGTFSAVFSDIQ